MRPVWLWLKPQLKWAICAASTCLGSAPAFAYTECPATTVVKVFAVDGGAVAVYFGTGKIGYTSGGVVPGITAIAITAMTTGRTVSARFASDTVTCAGYEFRTDLAGLYLNGP